MVFTLYLFTYLFVFSAFCVFSFLMFGNTNGVVDVVDTERRLSFLDGDANVTLPIFYLEGMLDLW